MLIWVVLWFGWEFVVELDAEVCDVVFHCEAAGAIDVVPLKVDAVVQVSLPVFSDLVVLFQDCSELDGVVLANIFATKIVNDKSEDDGVPLVAPEARSGGTLVIAMIFEELFKEDVG